MPKIEAYKAYKVPVIASANAVIDPDTVMVLSFNTVVADPTVMASWRSPDVARLAVLGREVHSKGILGI